MQKKVRLKSSLCRLVFLYQQTVFHKFYFSKNSSVALESGAAHHGDHIIVTGGFPLGVKGRTNMLHTVYIS